MKKVRLYTKEMELVKEGEVPPYLVPPEVILWGDRVFRLWNTIDDSDYDATAYRECFAVALV